MEGRAFYVEAGASTAEADRSCHLARRRRMRNRDHCGWLRPGYDADILIVGGDLRTDITRSCFGLPFCC
jgi:imidazolonepropionase-like amidohydrolase